MSPSKHIAVVVLNYNTREHLERFLPSVEQYSAQADLWILDNHSTDDSWDYLQRAKAHLKLHRLDRNYGFAGGYNRGLEQLKDEGYDLIVLINSDLEVTAHWLEPLWEAFSKDKKLAVAQPKILSYAHKNLFEYAGGSGGMLDQWAYPFCRGRLFDVQEEDTGQYDDQTEIFWASGAAFAIRPERFFEAGGFDEAFFAHMEEIDLCWRIHHLGYTVAAVPQSTVYHLGGGTLKQGSDFKYYLNYRNNLAMITKNTTARWWFALIVWKMLLDGLSAANFLIGGQPTVVWAIAKAHFSYWGRLGYWIKRRKQTLRNRPDRELLFQKSIVWNYFVRGKRKYSSL